VIVGCGLLGLLPLHAAWTEDATRPSGRRYALDAAVISYASTANALLLARAPAMLDRVLAVVEPDPVSLPELVGARGEAAAALSAFGAGDTLAGPRATIEQVVPALVQAPVVHFACHALSSLRNPRQSGIVLAGDRLLNPVGLAQLPLGRLRLAILSACETGVYGAQAPDEAIGLPSAFVEAGVGGVVAALWEVLDAGAMILLARFYELWRAEGHGLAEALVLAQRWLRDTTNAEKLEHWTAAWQRGTLPEETYEAATSDQVFRDAGARDFAHPADWAAFTFTGAVRPS
jgi:CHAT domain-containing protein